MKRRTGRGIQRDNGRDEKRKSSAALLLETRRRYNEVFEEAKGLRAIMKLAKSISAHLDLDSILGAAMKAAVVLTRAERGYLVLLEDGIPKVMAVCHIDSEAVNSEEFSFSKSMVQEVVNTGESVLSTNASEDERFAEARSVQLMSLRAVMAAPIRDADGKPIGAIYVDDPMRSGRFNTSTLKLLEGFADQVSMATQTAKLHEHLLKEKMRHQQMELARNIQLRLVPKEAPCLETLDVHWKYDPAYEVGGDLLQFLVLADQRPAVLIADVMGKGIPAALVMTKVHEAAKLLSGWVVDPIDLLARINRSLIEDMERGHMVTASLAVIEPDASAVTLARSGHCPMGVVRASSGEMEWVEPPGLALGIPHEEWRQIHQVARLELNRGDGILLITDGISEAMDLEWNEFGFERIQEYAAKNAPADARTFIDGLYAAIMGFRGDAEQNDDITLFYGWRK